MGIRRLPSEVANEVDDGGETVLTRLADFYRTCCCTHRPAWVARTTMDFLQRGDLQPSMVNAMRVIDGWCCSRHLLLPVLHLSLREKKPFRNSRSIGSANMDVALELLTSWADLSSEGIINRLTISGDTMLHHILEPANSRHAYDKGELEA